MCRITGARINTSAAGAQAQPWNRQRATMVTALIAPHSQQGLHHLCRKCCPVQDIGSQLHRRAVEALLEVEADADRVGVTGNLVPLDQQRLRVVEVLGAGL
eukprot:13655277-Alexandrium_andersonii.AAC.1